MRSDDCFETFLAMEPPTVTQQMHRVRVINGKPVFFDGPEVKAARMKLLAALIRQRPNAPFTEGIRLQVKWCFMVTGRHQNGDYRTTKPDTDNLQKLLKDCMTDAHYWKDDCLVCCEIVEKFWSDVPGIYIRIDQV